MSTLSAYQKKLGLLGELEDSKAAAGRIQEKPGTSCWARSKRVLKRVIGTADRTRASTGQILGTLNIEINNDSKGL